MNGTRSTSSRIARPDGRGRIGLAVAALLAGAATASGTLRAEDADWPQWRGPGGRGVWLAVELPATLGPESVRKRWSVPVGGGYSGIAVAGERVFTMDRPEKGRERVLCLARGSGETRWEHEYGADYGDMDHPNGPRSTPAVRDGRVYTVGATGRVFCLDEESGEIRWELDVERKLRAVRPTWGHAASPLLLGDLVILQAGARPGGTVLAVDRDDGAERWRAIGDRAGYATPALADVAGTLQLLVWTPENVHGLEPRTGKTLWTFPFETSSYDVSIASPVFHAGRLFVSGYWDGARAVDIAAGAEPRLAWQERVPSCLMSTPLWRDGCLYALDRRRGFLCVDWKTGDVLWSDEHRLTPAGRNPQATLVWAGDRAVALNADGELALLALSRERFEELGRVRIVGPTWAHPAFAGQEVFARSDSELVCVRVEP